MRSVAVRHEKFEKVWQEKMDRLSDRQFRGRALVIVVIGRGGVVSSVFGMVLFCSTTSVVQFCFVILLVSYGFVRQHGGCGPASLMVGNPLISTP